MSHSYGYYGYYFSAKRKIGAIPSIGMICNDHLAASIAAHQQYCGYCGNTLVPRISEDDELTFYEMVNEGAGNLPKKDIKYLDNHFMPFGDPEVGFDHLIPSTSQSFGVYLEEDNQFVGTPPKILGMRDTKKKLKTEIAMLKKHYEKVELVFGFISDYG